MNGRLTFGRTALQVCVLPHNARIAAARHLIKWLGLIWPDHLQRARTGKRLPRTLLTRRELSSVLDAASISENPASALVVTMMLDTGMRKARICSPTLKTLISMTVQHESSEGRVTRTVWCCSQSEPSPTLKHGCPSVLSKNWKKNKPAS